jgi:DNA-binding transcriptional MerR regulator
VKVGELARQLGIDRGTIYRWLEECPAVERYLSSSARGEDGMQRTFTAQDADVINTIRHLKAQNRTVAWDEIVAQLDDGKRITLYPSTALRMESRVVSVPQAEQAVELARMQAERDAALAEVEKLRQKNDEQSAEIKALLREVGKLEGLLEALRGKGE